MSNIGIAKHDAVPQDPGLVDVDLLADRRELLDGDGAFRYTDARHDNTRRAGFAVDALRGYVDSVGGRNEPVKTVISDLLSDLYHLCDLVGADFDELRADGYDHYCSEKLSSAPRQHCIDTGHYVGTDGTCECDDDERPVLCSCGQEIAPHPYLHGEWVHLLNDVFCGDGDHETRPAEEVNA